MKNCTSLFKAAWNQVVIIGCLDRFSFWVQLIHQKTFILVDSVHRNQVWGSELNRKDRVVHDHDPLIKPSGFSKDKDDFPKKLTIFLFLVMFDPFYHAIHQHEINLGEWVSLLSTILSKSTWLGLNQQNQQGDRPSTETFVIAGLDWKQRSLTIVVCHHGTWGGVLLMVLKSAELPNGCWTVKIPLKSVATTSQKQPWFFQINDPQMIPGPKRSPKDPLISVHHQQFLFCSPTLPGENFGVKTWCFTIPPLSGGIYEYLTLDPPLRSTGAPM